MRPDLQARADLTELGCPLEEGDLCADACQRQRGGRAADSAAGDDDVRSVANLTSISP